MMCLLTNTLYSTNINAILNDANSINLGSVYETVVASELIAHGFRLFYYDNRSKGEVDYIIDDYLNLTALPIEVKSGKLNQAKTIRSIVHLIIYSLVKITILKKLMYYLTNALLNKKEK